MPIAIDPKSGAAVFLDDAGEWKPAQTARNPQTNETLAFDGKTWTPVVPKARSLGQLGGDVALSVGQGATMGWAGEGLAAGQTALGMGKPTYEENLADWAAREKEIPLQIKIPGEVAGAVGASLAAAPVLGPAAVATGAARLPAWLRYVGMGTALGGIQGAGEAEPGQRLGGAVGGAALGGVTGLGVPALGKAGREIYGAFAPNANVTQQLLRSMTRDKDTPQAFLQRFQEAQAVRPGVATPLDVAGPNTQGLVERIAQTPGAGVTRIEPLLTDRQKGQMARVTADLRSLTGTHQKAHEAITDTIAQREAAADPLYQQAYNFNARAVPDIVQAFERETAGGWGRSILLNPEFRKTLQTKYGITDPTNAPLMVVIDAWKKQADDVVGDLIRANKKNTAGVVSEMRDRVVGIVDQHNPAYAKARDAWAGPSRYLDAIEEGRNVLGTKIDPDELTAALGAMSASEREGFKIGAVSSIISMMGRDAAKMADFTKYVRSPDARAKIAAIMPDQASRDLWTKRLDFEVGSSELVGKTLRGSPTAKRTAQQQDQESIVGDLVLSAFAGTPPVGLLKRAVGAVPTKIRDTLRSRSDDILAELLTDPNSMQGLIKAMDRVTQGAGSQSVLRTGTAINAAIAATPEGK